MDCRTARLLIDLAHPSSRELEAADLAALEQHLTECSECGPLTQTERQADVSIAQAMRAVPIPDGLRDRLLNRLDADYRQAVRRRWRSVRWYATAAAVLLTVGLGYGVWHFTHRPVLDLGDVLAEALERRGATPEQVEQWFQEHYGTKIVAPPQFNYAYLATFDLNRERVPQLLFVRGERYAYVRILTSWDVNVAASLEQPRQESGGFAVDLLRHPANPNVVYLIIHTGGTIDWLLAEGQQFTA
jgi:hypothetical protein